MTKESKNEKDEKDDSKVVTSGVVSSAAPLGPLPFNQITWIYLLGAHHCNPNGCPDHPNGAPRTMPDGRGLITAWAIRRRIRDYMSRIGVPVLLLAETPLSLKQREVYENTPNAEPGDPKSVGPATETALTSFADLRLFGMVGGTGDAEKAGFEMDDADVDADVDAVKKNGDKKNGKKPKTKKLALRNVRGCITMDHAMSVDPVRVIDIAGTAPPRNVGDTRTMTRSSIVECGLYLGHATIDAYTARTNGVTRKDVDNALAWFAEAMPSHHSSAVPQGLPFLGLWLIEHSHPDGNVFYGALDAALTIRRRNTDEQYPHACTDYEITFDASKLPSTIRVVDYLNDVHLPQMAKRKAA